MGIADNEQKRSVYGRCPEAFFVDLTAAALDAMMGREHVFVQTDGMPPLYKMKAAEPGAFAKPWEMRCMGDVPRIMFMNQSRSVVDPVREAQARCGVKRALVKRAIILDAGDEPAKLREQRLRDKKKAADAKRESGSGAAVAATAAKVPGSSPAEIEAMVFEAATPLPHWMTLLRTRGSTRSKLMAFLTGEWKRLPRYATGRGGDRLDPHTWVVVPRISADTQSYVLSAPPGDPTKAARGAPRVLVTSPAPALAAADAAPDAAPLPEFDIECPRQILLNEASYTAEAVGSRRYGYTRSYVVDSTDSDMLCILMLMADQYARRAPQHPPLCVLVRSIMDKATLNAQCEHVSELLGDDDKELPVALRPHVLASPVSAFQATYVSVDRLLRCVRTYRPPAVRNPVLGEVYLRILSGCDFVSPMPRISPGVLERAYWVLNEDLCDAEGCINVRAVHRLFLLAYTHVVNTLVDGAQSLPPTPALAAHACDLDARHLLRAECATGGAPASGCKRKRSARAAAVTVDDDDDDDSEGRATDWTAMEVDDSDDEATLREMDALMRDSNTAARSDKAEERVRTRGAGYDRVERMLDQFRARAFKGFDAARAACSEHRGRSTAPAALPVDSDQGPDHITRKHLVGTCLRAQWTLQHWLHAPITGRNIYALEVCPETHRSVWGFDGDGHTDQVSHSKLKSFS
jgi:hypothetical protein